jgi:phage/plasmid primase-like uncharacterized protein
MLTYRTIAAGAPSIAKAFAEHVMVETDVPELHRRLAEYFGKEMQAKHGEIVAIPRRDMDIKGASLLGLDVNRPTTLEEVTHLMTGLRCDGVEVEGKQQQQSTAKKVRLSGIDFTLSAPKSYSVALAFAPTESERAMLEGAYREAVDATMAYIETQIAWARRGDAGKKGKEKGHLAWIQFDHYTSRPTVELPFKDGLVTGTILQTVKVAGDMQRHTHTFIPNVVWTDEGHVGSFDLNNLKDKVKIWGSIFQIHLATNLRKLGVEVEVEKETEMARLTSVPKWICEVFSKRTKDGEAAAKAYAARQGINWDRLSDEERIKFLDGGTRKARRFKGDDLADYAEWLRQAREVGYEHRSVLRPGQELEPAEDRTRLRNGYVESLKYLDPKLQKNSKFNGWIAQKAAVTGLIATGSLTPEQDMLDITKAYRTEGVRQNGKMTSLWWGRDSESHFQSFTTDQHIKQERMAIKLLARAGKDKSSALSRREIEAAVKRFLGRNPKIDPTDAHWKKQRTMIDRLGTGGRAAVGIGVGGAGKTTLIEPLVDAWHQRGFQTYGVTLAWRQTHALSDAGVGGGGKRQFAPDTRQLTDAGIDQKRTYALTAFIHGVQKGYIRPDRNSVVVVDEIAQIGTRQILDLALLQRRHGFQIVGLGDQKQCSAIEAGNTIKLFRHALGAEQIPQILDTIRQANERERITASLFRQGEAAKALARKEEDQTIQVVPGGYRHAVEAAVRLWEERRAANAETPHYTLGISVPTNEDVLKVGEALRQRRRELGAVGEDKVFVTATDQEGTARNYELAIAVGDKLRVFTKINNGTSGRFADNGTVVEVLDVRKRGLVLRNQQGTVAQIKWAAFKDKKTGIIRLTYGDALTIDSRQGDTVTEHITAMPNGSQAVNGFKGYVAESRHRIMSWIITSEGKELAEVEGRRPLGDPRNFDKNPASVRAAIIKNMARNLSRQEEKELAIDLIGNAHRVLKGTIRAMNAAWHRREVREQQGQPATTMATQIADRHAEAAVAEIIPALQQQQQAVAEVVERIRNPTPPPPRRPERPKKPVISETEVQAEFAAALERAGFRLKGPPVMDGKMHRAPVEGDKGSMKSGSYKGYMDDYPSGYVHNFRTREEFTWSSKGALRESSAAELEERRRRIEEENRKRQQERADKEERTSAVSEKILASAIPVIRHEYLERKNVYAHGLRQDRQGRLLVPMQDEHGKFWNLQRIAEDGEKRFMSGRTKDLFTVLGEIQPGEAVGIAEGFATAASVREATGLPVVVAFNTGNLKGVAKAIRAQTDGPIVFFADNDDHLTHRNPPLENAGLGAAHEAAREVQGVVVAPTFEPIPGVAPVDDRRSDWNDRAVPTQELIDAMDKEAARREAKRAVRAELQERLDDLGVETQFKRGPRL